MALSSMVVPSVTMVGLTTHVLETPRMPGITI
jgi:hypothetical protein